MSRQQNGPESAPTDQTLAQKKPVQENLEAFQIMQDILTSDEPAPLVSGFGQYHTNKGEKPRPYIPITLEQVRAMVDAPQQVEKSNARWLIPSSLLSREVAEQRINGQYFALWADVDKVSGETFDSIVSRTVGALACELWIYSSRSATEKNPKCRVIIPLAAPVTGAQFVLLQRVLNDRLRAAGIEPDSVNERPNQLCYLPNRGEFYQTYSDDYAPRLHADEWEIEIEALQAEQERHQAEQQAQAQAAQLKTRSPNLTGKDARIIDLANDAYDMDSVLRAHGYKQIGKRYISPNSESGAPAILIFEREGKEVIYSFHGPNDPLSQHNHDGHALDVFDALVALQYGGDVKRAIATLADQVDPEGQKERQRAHMQAEQAKKDAAAIEAQTQTDPLAENAVDLFNTLKLPPFPLALLPDAIGNYAKDQAELIGVDPAVIAMAAIGAAAACIDDRIQIQPKRYDTGWRESARLWVGIIGDPSAKKSPGISKAMAPLFKIDHQWREESDQALAAWLQACDETPKGETEPPAPRIKRLILNDATVEKMGDILSKSEPRGILSHQDELSGWLASMDAYKNGAGGKDKAAWLEAYNGGPKAIDRVTRGSTFVENWSACVIGGIQPSVVQAYANATNHDGMLQRFVLVQASEARLGVDRYPDRQARDKYNDLMQHLAGLCVGNDSVVTLSAGAHKARETLETKLHRITLNYPNKYLTAALGKWSGLYARLLLVFHCVECAKASKYPTVDDVSGETAQRVADLMWRTLLPHAMRFYNGLDAVQDSARELAALILAHGWERFTVKRDLDRYWRASRTLKPWQVEETLDRLEAFAWLYPEPGKLNEKGKPAAYLVNPGVHARFHEQAQRERERRKAVAEMLRDIKAPH